MGSLRLSSTLLDTPRRALMKGETRGGGTGGLDLGGNGKVVYILNLQFVVTVISKAMGGPEGSVRYG
jgi:hypothetical protein